MIISILTFEVVSGIYEASWDMIRSYLGTIDWRDAFRNCSGSDMWAKFKSVVQHSMELYVPKYHKISKIKCYWSSNFIRSLIRRKKRMYQSFKSIPSRCRK